jgi:kynurenine formamidase
MTPRRNVLATVEQPTGAAGWLLVALPLIVSCNGQAVRDAPAGEAAASMSVAAAADLRALRPVDLTYTFDESTLYWPTSPTRFELEELADGPTEAGFYYSSYSLRTPEHGGTHLDAPVHFGEGMLSVDEVPLERLIVPAVVIDVSQQAAVDQDYRLTVADLEAWELEHGSVPEGAAVLLRTGWGRHWPDPMRYLGDDRPGDASSLHFPSFGEEAVRYLIEGRGVVVLGVDTASIDYGPSTDFPVHRLAAAADVCGLENLANLDEVPATGAWLIALPMKIGGGSGAPLRAVALVPRSG